MKKMSFAFIAVAFIALLSAFATKNTTTTNYKVSKVGNVFTFQSIDYVPVDEATGETQGLQYTCTTTTPNPECTSIVTEQPALHNSIKSISKTAYDARTSVVNGLFAR